MSGVGGGALDFILSWSLFRLQSLDFKLKLDNSKFSTIQRFYKSTLGKTIYFKVETLKSFSWSWSSLLDNSLFKYLSLFKIFFLFMWFSNDLCLFLYRNALSAQYLWGFQIIPVCCGWVWHCHSVFYHRSHN